MSVLSYAVLKWGKPVVNRFCHVSVLSYAVLKWSKPVVNRVCHVSAYVEICSVNLKKCLNYCEKC